MIDACRRAMRRFAVNADDTMSPRPPRRKDARRSACRSTRAKKTPLIDADAADCRSRLIHVARARQVHDLAAAAQARRQMKGHARASSAPLPLRTPRPPCRRAAAPAPRARPPAPPATPCLPRACVVAHACRVAFYAICHARYVVDMTLSPTVDKYEDDTEGKRR